jgi:hypothetical protein
MKHGMETRLWYELSEKDFPSAFDYYMSNEHLHFMSCALENSVRFLAKNWHASRVSLDVRGCVVIITLVFEGFYAPSPAAINVIDNHMEEILSRDYGWGTGPINRVNENAK